MTIRILVRAIFVVALFLFAQPTFCQVWQDLLTRADSLADAKDAESAASVLREALDSFETELGYADSTGYLRFFQNSQLKYIYCVNSARTQKFYLKALTVAEKVYGEYHVSLTNVLLRLAALFWNRDEYLEMKSVAERGLSLAETNYGTSDPNTAEFLNLLAVAESELLDMENAEIHFKSALAIAKESLGERSLQAAWTMYKMAWYYYDGRGELSLADELAIEAETIFTDSLGAGDLLTLAALHVQAWIHEARGEYTQAQALFKDLLYRQNLQYGPECFDAISAHTDIGLVAMRMGQFSEAEENLKQALAISEKIGYPECGDAGRALNLLALTYDGQGRFEEAKETYQRALAIRKKRFGERTTWVAYTLTDLGLAYWSLREFDSAQSLIEQAIDIFKETEGPEDEMVAIGNLNLGLVYESQGKYHAADSVLTLSVTIGEKSLSPGHPALAHALNNLANLYTRLGRYDDAEPLLTRAVGILESALGPEHPEVAKFRRDLGRLLAYAGKSDECLESYDLFIDWSQRFLENVFPYSSEVQKLNWMHEYPIIDHTVFAVAMANDSDRARMVALEMLLKSKAMVVEAVMSERKVAYCIADESITANLDELNEIHTIIASLAMAGGEFSDSLKTLYLIKDSLEVILSRHCSEFGDALAARRFEVTDVTSAIPRESVLWEFLRYQPADLSPDVVGDDKIGPERYLGFVVDSDGFIVIKDLGDATHIDSLVSTARDLMYKAQGQIYSPAALIAEDRLKEITGQIYELVFAPMALASGGKTDVYISPDGMLNLLPFEILPTPNGTYVIEDYRISYLSSGRDLLKYKSDEPSSGDIIVMADPDFDGSATLSAVGKTPLTVATVSSEMYGPDMRGVTDCLQSSFSRLGHTRQEASSVAKRFKAATRASVLELYDNQAVEGALKNLSDPPRVLHLATHGFFCETGEAQISVRDNPLLRSGLVLTGANKTIAGTRNDSTSTEDGILTALEVSGLNLVGTDLAVLSACESGVGDFVNGEGLFGLRRAFQHAGVETIIMSLWSVPDEETSQLMDGFYRRWLEGSSKRDALRESALEVLNNARTKRGCGHPLLWGGFILAGNPN